MAKRNQSNWDSLFRNLESVYMAAGQKRKFAVLKNKNDSKEKILRRLNVVCPGDISRIAREVKLIGRK